MRPKTIWLGGSLNTLHKILTIDLLRQYFSLERVYFAWNEGKETDRKKNLRVGKTFWCQFQERIIGRVLYLQTCIYYICIYQYNTMRRYYTRHILYRARTIQRAFDFGINESVKCAPKRIPFLFFSLFIYFFYIITTN